MPHLICYDITRNSLRQKISNKLIEYGLDRINLSVFLGTISKSSLKSLETWLINKMAENASPDDSLIIISVAAHQVNAMKVLGKNDLDKEELNGEKQL